MMRDGEKIIVIGERHDDTSAIEVITALIPALSKEGYEFYDEQPRSQTAEEALKLLVAATELVKNSYCKISAELQAKQETIKDWAKLMQTLQDYKMSYRGIDDTKGREIYEKDRKLGMRLRDNVMAKALLTATKPIICRVGVGHFPGIQRRIIASLGDNIATQNRFLFIYPYKNKYSTPKEPYFAVMQFDLHHKKVEVIRDTVLEEIKKSKLRVVDDSSINHNILDICYLKHTVSAIGSGFYNKPESIKAVIEKILKTDSESSSDTMTLGKSLK